jgi:hypothetical protein
MCSNNVVKLNNRGATINSQDYQLSTKLNSLVATINYQQKIGARRPLVSHFGVTVKPFPVLPCLGISAVLLGLFKCQAPQHSSVGPVDVWSVKANDVVHVSPF